jgi:hypothetical protein
MNRYVAALTAVEIAPGEFKSLADCTRADLQGAHEVAVEAAGLWQQSADYARTLGEIADASGGTVSVTVSQWKPSNLIDLREHVGELQRLVRHHGRHA